MADFLHPTRREFLAALSASTAALIVGCAKAPEPTPAPTAKPAAAQPTAVPPTAEPEPAAAGGPKKELPRHETVVHRGGDTEILEPTNFNPYSLGGLGRIRQSLNKTFIEFLYYYNHNNGEEIPWLAESYKTADDAKSVAVTLRKGVTWSDGEPFTSDDVKYTLEKLRDTPELTFHADMKEWVKEVAVEDDQHFTIVLNKANPRFFYYYFVENSEIQIAILPKHIWENQDWTTFENYDPEKGWPIGTGSWKLVEAGPQGLFYDRDDNYWGVKTGFVQPSKITRHAFIPTGNATSTFARMINNEVDVDVTPQPGEFVAGRATNPKLQSWNAEGPSWGAPDACMFTLGVNTRWGPCSDVHVRRAIQASLDRQQIVDLSYEGATIPLVLPFSTYGGLKPYRDMCADLVAKYNPDNQDMDLIASEMEQAGYAKDDDGYWAKDGETWEPVFWCASWLGPMAPIVEKQLKDAGFKVEVNLITTTGDPFFEAVRQGRADIWIIVHCGSSREPWGTLQHYHSKFSSPEQGQPTSYVWANSQYQNPEYDALIDKLDTIVPSPDDPNYTDLVLECIDIYLRDVIEITMSEERWVRTYNYHYWKGWPNAEDPYVAPYALWASIMLAFFKVEPTGETS